ncbi:glycine oxidase ThiO [Paenibacillus baekrokdamisoli]|uniref:glycine oxidase n=1 Tax=Paenibacillus baekrokdamisoli TaxID=1712516 RepID=A0A3G9J1E2_9BACL|nr:glycine oxidase ThiO [Paenibacillus baekrokdamisoli]MBB3069426.1 glycine oxidase [Paenibacillus baekrokdamisoli]BBH25000.1 glycine oxidase ThiO [Paenibacillus baekrokdamisoli]
MPERIVVLGGGIIGLSCAFEAARNGSLVTVVEPSAIGGQASGAAAGMLAPYTENPEQPDAFFQLCMDSLKRYPAWVEQIESLSGMNVELMPTGSITVAMHEADLLPLQTRMAWQQRYGAAAELIGAEQLRHMEPKLAAAIAGAIYCPSESHVHAPKLVAALEVACLKLGIQLMSHAGEIKLPAITKDPLRMETAIETSEYGRIVGDKLIICAGAWASKYAELFGFPIPIHPIRGQICSFDIASEAGAEAGAVKHMVFSSQAYWVGKQDGTLICGASEDVAGYDTTVTERGIESLIRWGPRVFPFLEGKRPLSSWAGLRPATLDGWPLIGTIPGREDIIIAAGHYRNGILLSPATAAMVGSLLRGDSLKGSPFAPERFAKRGSGVQR